MHLNASDPRDYIYAFRGLASQEDPVSKALVTSYTKTPDEIYTEFTRLLYDQVGRGPQIDTILLSQIETKSIPGLPT